MTYTSINHCKNGNYQVDHTQVAYFEDWCIKNEVFWARLFESETGVMVATYSSIEGLISLSEY